MNTLRMANYMLNNFVRVNLKVLHREIKPEKRKQACMYIHEQSASGAKKKCKNAISELPWKDNYDATNAYREEENKQFEDEWDIPESKWNDSNNCSRDLEDLWSEMSVIEQCNLEKLVTFKDEDDENFYDSGLYSDVSDSTDELFEELDSSNNIKGSSIFAADSIDWYPFPKHENPADVLDFIDEDIDF